MVAKDTIALAHGQVQRQGICVEAGPLGVGVTNTHVQSGILKIIKILGVCVGVGVSVWVGTSVCVSQHKVGVVVDTHARVHAH